MSELPFGGNISSIKKDILESPNQNLIIREALSFMLQKENPNRKTKFIKKIFVGEYSEIELKEKFFSHLSEQNIVFLIDYFPQKLKMNNLGVLKNCYKLLLSKFMNIQKISEIRKEIEKHKSVINSTR